MFNDDNSRTSLALQVVIALLASAACGAGDHGLSARSRAITNGQPHTGHPSVGRLRVGASLCTATLVGQRTVLTAAHCVSVTKAATFTLGGQPYASASVHRHPSYLKGGSHDIAVVILEAAPPVSPSFIATPELSPRVGLSIAMVGYGTTSSSKADAGLKRIAKNTIYKMNSVDFSYLGSGGATGSTCKGDSGGPAFAVIKGQELQVGVTSRGVVPCGVKGIDTRVDVFAAWLHNVAGGDVNAAQAAPGQDSTPPRVTIRSPDSGQAVPTGRVEVEASITDDVAVTRAQILDNGQVRGTLDHPPWDFTLTLAGGGHVVKVVGYDSAGNKGEDQITLTRDESPLESPKDELGAACDGPADCLSGLCAVEAAGGYCTVPCDPIGAPVCGAAGCLTTGGAPSHVCGDPATDRGAGPVLIGGCSAGGGEARGAVWSNDDPCAHRDLHRPRWPGARSTQQTEPTSKPEAAP